jgi:hypothetical protein
MACENRKRKTDFVKQINATLCGVVAFNEVTCWCLENRIITTTTYNGQFPGPLLRMKERQRVTVDVHNETDVPEQLHWHGQFVGADVDGAAEERSDPQVVRLLSQSESFVPGGLEAWQLGQTCTRSTPSA